MTIGEFCLVSAAVILIGVHTRLAWKNSRLPAVVSGIWVLWAWVPLSATWVLFALSGIAKELQPPLASRELVWSLVGVGINVLLLGFFLGQLVMC